MLEQLRLRDQLAGERQQLSNDLSKLQKNLRDTARELASNQPGVSQKLRDALTEMDQSDIDNHVQRTADWLRSGINPNSNGTENEIAQGLQKLSQELRQAQQAMGQEKPVQGQGKTGAEPGDETAMLNQIERLRNQLDAMNGGQPKTQNGQRQGRNPSGQPNYIGQQQRDGGQSDQQQGGLRAMAPTARKREIDWARSVATCAMEVELLRTAMSWAIPTLGTTVMAQQYIGMFQPTPQVILQMVSAYTSKACVS
jgi:hypothetical protein